MTTTPSRYDMMHPGATTDSFDGQAYPDTLLVNYNNFKFYSPPTNIAPNDRMLNAPYITTYAIYQIAAYDDIVLNINAVTQISFLDKSISYNDTIHSTNTVAQVPRLFSMIKIPVMGDLITFMRA